ncbi:hypothetical protein ACW2QC_11685 [Virgibacillus sp. FSP13]
MGSCNIDHSHQDVVKKLESQKQFLPEDVYEKVSRFSDNENSQATLNELFHLLKKYDLAPKTEREDRDKKLIALIT